MVEAHISGFGASVPNDLSTERFLAVDGEARRLHGQSEDTIELVRRLTLGTGIQNRHTFHPALLGPGVPTRVDVDDIYGPSDFDPDFWQRMAAWKQVVPPIAVEAVQRALDDWGGDPRDITHIITTGTSGWSEPGIACHVMDHFGLRDDCQKAELNFNGCHCGATCLRLARDAVRGGEAGYVLVVAAESPTTHYSPVETDVSTLVATCLFSDGAAAFVVGPEGPWRYELARMNVVPGSRDLAVMTPPMVPGQVTYRMFLGRSLGAALGDYFRTGAGAGILDQLERDLPRRPSLAVHPGGPNILEHVAEALVERGYPQDALRSSFDTLHGHGNLGAAALPYVLTQVLGGLDDDVLATFAFGPGVTVEWSRFRRT